MNRVLVLAPLDPVQLKRLSKAIPLVYEPWTVTNRLHDPEELGQRLSDGGISHVVIEADFVFRETMSKAPRLRFIGLCRNAVNQVDLEAATERGVLVVNTPGRNAQAVAELTVGLVLSLARHIPQAHAYVTRGDWTDPTEAYQAFRGTEAAGKTAGIVGLGSIGKLVARALQGLGMNVLASDPAVAGDQASASGVQMVALEELLRRSDFVLVHVPAIPATVGLLGPKELAGMKRTAFLVNTSAAGVVDEKALVEALETKTIAGAALDVFEGQPLPLSSKLLTLENVLLTPHIGGATNETVRRYSTMVVDDVLLEAAGKKPLHLVNPKAWEIRTARERH